MTKKEYVEGYVEHLNEALLHLFDESKEEEILTADKTALGDDYRAFENVITEAYEKVEQARDMLKEFADTLQ